MWVQSLGWGDALEKEVQPTQVFLSEKSHGQGGAWQVSLWGHKELDVTERTHSHNGGPRLVQPPTRHSLNVQERRDLPRLCSWVLCPVSCITCGVSKYGFCSSDA